MHHANWIDGSWDPARSGDRFLCDLEGEWPRSGAAEVAEALEAARRASATWREIALEGRIGWLEDVLDRWEEGGAEGGIATLLGLGERGLDPLRDQAIELADGMIDDLEEGPPSPKGGAPCLVRVPAAELFTGLVRAVFTPLLAGRTVLLLSDPELPHLAASFCDLLHEIDLPRGVVSLLHDDRSEVLRAAVGTGGVASIHYEGNPSRLEVVERILAGGVSLQPVPGLPAPFGAGVIELPPPEVHLGSPRNSGYLVRRDDDPALAAERVCRGAFSAVEALSGQRAGQIGKVLCHIRHFSAFTEALLEEVDALGEEGCALFDRELPAHVEELGRLGLDEGATMIRGELGKGARRSRRKGRAPVPMIFTNVEEGMELARATRPAPVLSLVRVERGGEE